METPKQQLYDEEKRGSKAPEYSPAEEIYRSKLLDALQMDYMLREKAHMELDDKTYSEYYLINRQQDMAYNPPRKNASDSRIVSGITHEKDNTILSILDGMNFQPKVRIYDKDNVMLEDASTVLTAMLKKSLMEENFKVKESEYFRVNIAQGNVFIEERPYTEKYVTKKLPISGGRDPLKLKWKTVIEKEDEGCNSSLIPNTAVFMPNLLERDIHKQDHVWVVLHMAVSLVEPFFKDFPRWANVPKSPTRTVPSNVNGIWGDYYLQQPQDKYIEVAMYQSEVRNEYQILLNGVMMYPVQEESENVCVGFPLTHFSPSGKYTVVKGDNEPIPFFAYGKSVPSKTEVKEETLNELMRLMVYKMRQAARPPVGNNTDKILPANIWDPGIITPDVKESELSILTPNAGITAADFSFYKLTTESIGDSSVDSSLEGQNNDPNITLGQYTDQKKQNLRKLGISIDNAINFLKEIYWLRLFNEMQYITEKKKKYDHDTGKEVNAFDSFTIDESNVDGTKSKLSIKFVDDNYGRTSQKVLNEEKANNDGSTKIYARPEYIRDVVEKLRDKMYIDVISEPDGQQQSLLAILFNLLTQYANLRGGQIPNLNYEYLDKVVGQNSGFESDKLFLKTPPPVPGVVDPMNPGGIVPNTPDGMPVGPKGKASAPKLPMNPAMNHTQTTT